jgi:hypothetical protein
MSSKDIVEPIEFLSQVNKGDWSVEPVESRTFGFGPGWLKFFEFEPKPHC